MPERTATIPLLETKLYVPRPRRHPVTRRRLNDRLAEGLETTLTLISAPAGFGKTTLLAEWIAAFPKPGHSTAWLSLDQGDSYPPTFWTYLIAALQTVVPGVGARALAHLAESQPPSIESILAILLNELAAADQDVVLVLDDYHLVEGHDIGVGMEFLLEHLPPRVHVVIATRADPSLRLSRLRARGELVEIRAADLRFRPEEAASYLNEAMRLDLSAADVEALERRTEGWIAALQLAALSIQGRDDADSFIAGFAGDDRYIVDYLVEEVLHRQTDEVRTFLLETSILVRMTGALCDAVTGGSDAGATLETLDRRNLFLVPLDDRRQWYRYHHLFGDVLQARLLAEYPERVAGLHRRAGEWYERAGDRPEAIRHALAGDDFGRAANLIELAMPAVGRDRQDATLRCWLEALPDEIIRTRPVLSDGYAGSILVRGQTEGVDARLRDAERWLDLPTAPSDAPDGPHVPEGSDAARGAADAARGATADDTDASMVVADEDAYRKLPASVAIHRAGLALLLGDLDGTISHARRARELVGEDDHLGRGAASALLGLAFWSQGDLEAASDLYAGAIPRFESIGHLSDAIGLSLALADMRIAQGRLHDAMHTYERGLGFATVQRTAVRRGAADMHVGIAEILRERGDLARAADHVRQARDLGEENGLPQNPYRWRVAAARIKIAEGDLDAALVLLAEAGHVYATDFSPGVRPVEALTARVWVAQGRLSEAAEWARQRGLSASDEPSYVREFEHVTLARLLLAEAAREHSDDRSDEAIHLLERLLAAAEAGGRTGTVIEILIVLALARRARNDPAVAFADLERAVTLAEPEGYVRVFADEGPAMAGLLKLATQGRSASPYQRRLLAATVTASAPADTGQPLIEPLSERELEVLRLLESELDGPDIARELTVSLATVRTHTRNIYAKLGVNNRRGAVRRAAELGLLSHARGARPGA